MVSFRGIVRSALRITGVTALGAALLAPGLGAGGRHPFESDLPKNPTAITDYRPIRASQIFSTDGEMIGEFFVEKRVLVPIEKVPDMVRKAFVAAEDARFYQH